MTRWTVHPARRRPMAALGAVAFVALASVLAAHALGPGSGFYAWIFAVLLIGSLTPFFFPTTYVIDDSGVTVQHLGTTRRREWKAIRRIDVGPARVVLSPFPAPRTLDRFRAVVVMLQGAPSEAREELAARAAALRSGGLPDGPPRDRASP